MRRLVAMAFLVLPLAARAAAPAHTKNDARCATLGKQSRSSLSESDRAFLDKTCVCHRTLAERGPDGKEIPGTGQLVGCLEKGSAAEKAMAAELARLRDASSLATYCAKHPGSQRCVYCQDPAHKSDPACQ
ncbi:MAG TPA: hypothetical protein VFP65_21520 [Anaeromyxobacteraceae bacterium]|nr:hypothetical protein [Anaeromyxobacteraceae bacterium]